MLRLTMHEKADRETASNHSLFPMRSYQVIASASFYDSAQPLFASSDPDTSLSDSYSATTCHPSLFFLVVLLSFGRFPIKRFLAACVLAALDFPTNAFEDGVQLAFKSNGF